MCAIHVVEEEEAELGEPLCEEEVEFGSDSGGGESRHGENPKRHSIEESEQEEILDIGTSKMENNSFAHTPVSTEKVSQRVDRNTCAEGLYRVEDDAVNTYFHVVEKGNICITVVK